MVTCRRLVLLAVIISAITSLTGIRGSATAQTPHAADWRRYDRQIKELFESGQGERAISIAMSAISGQLSTIEAGEFEQGYNNYLRALAGIAPYMSDDEYYGLRIQAIERVGWSTEPGIQLAVSETRAIIQQNEEGPRRAPRYHVRALLTLAMTQLQVMSAPRVAQELADEALAVARRSTPSTPDFDRNIAAALHLLSQLQQYDMSNPVLYPEYEFLPNAAGLTLARQAYEASRRALRESSYSVNSQSYRDTVNLYLTQLTRSLKFDEALRIVDKDISEQLETQRSNKKALRHSQLMRAAALAGLTRYSEAEALIRTAAESIGPNETELDAVRIEHGIVSIYSNSGDYQRAKMLAESGLTRLSKLTATGRFPAAEIQKVERDYLLELSIITGRMGQNDQMVKHATEAFELLARMGWHASAHAKISLAGAQVSGGRYHDAEPIILGAIDEIRSEISGQVLASWRDTSEQARTLAKDLAAPFRITASILAQATDGALKDRTRLEDHLVEMAQLQLTSEAGFAEAQILGLSGSNSDANRTIRRLREIEHYMHQLRSEMRLATDQSASRWQVNYLELRRTGKEREQLLLEIMRDHPSVVSSISNGGVLTRAEIQSALRDDELLIFVVPQVRPSWAQLLSDIITIGVTKREIIVSAFPYRAGLIQKHEFGVFGDLERHVAALRCGLDRSAWDSTGGTPCQAALGVTDPPSENESLPYDVAQAHQLYSMLFGRLSGHIPGRRLLIMASGPLAKIPLNVLVTHPTPTATSHAKVPWLGISSPITMLTTLATIKARRPDSRDQLTGRYLGVGNPLLTGEAGTSRAAHDAPGCERNSRKTDARQRSTVIRRVGSNELFSTDVEALRRQSPLPETVDEICSTASAWSSHSDAEVWLGDQANEDKFKEYSESGALKSISILHFATHGLLARETGEFKRGLPEAALLLTPPSTPTERNDGLLTASEIAKLDLSAFWVVLSACNTATGAASDADAVGELATAFFTAGAKGVLASHWYVDSIATAELIKGALAHASTNPESGKSGALLASMAALVGRSESYAHPSIWSPFVNIGAD